MTDGVMATLEAVYHGTPAAAGATAARPAATVDVAGRLRDMW